MRPERSDPTPAGFTPPATGHVRLSMNEVEALCLKAARGAGYDWGLAEEAGFAARWLYSRGLDGPGALAAHLDREAGEAPGMGFVGGVFRAEGAGYLCPISLGAALSDFAGLGRYPVQSDPVDQPLLLVPFLHQIAATAGHAMALTWSGGRVTVSAAGSIAGDLASLASLDKAAIEVAPAPGGNVRGPTAPGPAPTDAETLGRLDTYAMQTTVPASASSRADAGSGGSDND